MYHVTRLGKYGPQSCADMQGYIPEADDGPWDLDYDHGMERTHDDDGTLTEYGEWWESDRWPEILAEAEKATSDAEKSLAEWQGT